MVTIFGKQVTVPKLIGGLFATVVLLGMIPLANWAISTYGFVPVGFGLAAPAGVYFAGFSLAARDAVQDILGRWAIAGLILIGSLISLALSEKEIALASFLAFMIAEFLNFAVYTPLREKSKLGDKRWAAAVVLSNLAGAVADTAVFLGVAFGAAAILPAMPGMLVGKMWATVVYLVIGRVIASIVQSQKVPQTTVEVV